MNSSTSSSASHQDGPVDVLIVDWQGGLRGKRLPGTHRGKILQGQARIPVSTQALDIWGDDCDEITGLGLSIGDPDGLCIPNLEQCDFHDQPWNAGHQQILCSLHNEDGAVSEFDSRAILQGAVESLHARQLFPVVAVELEFYLMDESVRTTGIPMVPSSLNVAGPPNDLQLYDMRAMDRVSDVLQDIHAFAQAMGISAETQLAEYGPGQFEINLKHQADPLKAADHAVLFKQLVDRAAYKHGLLASFMAKPYTEHAGCGQHVHVSLLNESGDNLFDRHHGNPDTLLHAVAGCLKHLEASQLFLAPHANSYRRLQPESFAPVRCDWSYDHRGVSIRLPETEGVSARLEHRVAGADANPYLVMAVVLNSISDGLSDAQSPTISPLLPGEPASAKALTHDWVTAISRAADSPWLRATLGERFIDLYTRVKHHEARKINRQVSDIELNTYLPRI